MKLKLIRLGSTTKGNGASLGALYIDNELVCGTVEDEKRSKKKWGETRIPEGTYKVGLRSIGGFHNRYKHKFADIHRGMLCIYNNKADWSIEAAGMRFQYILLHIGNYERDTAGCVLVNDVLNFDKFTGAQSTAAYKDVYPIIADYIAEHGDIEIEIIDAQNG